MLSSTPLKHLHAGPQTLEKCCVLYADAMEVDTYLFTRLSPREKLVEEWVERSATCSLSGSLYDSTNHSCLAIGEHTLLLQLLPFSRRLCNLALSGDAEFLRPFLWLGAEDQPPLQSLSTPTLRNITLCMTKSVDPHSIPPQWAQLTNLRFDCSFVWTGQDTEGGLSVGGALHLFPKWHWHLVVPKLCFLFMGQFAVSAAVAKNFPLDGSGCAAELDPGLFTLSAFEDLLQSFPIISNKL
ncbi:hypothetical protein MSAN_01395200 [Mycena sanguinolenta]|uniref:Uncharacterized protein n=1 Tax=Mycena sanguinolenta TaxID=230812 RepID=A0A8H6Y9B4_9AGAR|nr:hypothetical protein MSAN_01395200 [Mycena sanguinolenta]